LPDIEQETNMDPLLIVLIIVAVIAFSGWGYGTYAIRPAPAAATEVLAGPAWVSPLGIIGLIVVVGILIMLFTGWQPFLVAA
jgi:hypothetical protein